MNRITNAISRMASQVASKNLSPEKLTQVSKSLDMELGEYCRFQELKSAYVGTKLSLDEAQTVYACLGQTPEDFNRQPVHVKAVLTQLFSELLKATIR